MSNRNPKNQFGKDGMDPREAGKRSVKNGLTTKSIGRAIIRKLRDFQNLPFKEYQRLKREGKIPDDANEMLAVLMAGEEGFDYLLNKKVSLMEHYTKEEIELNKVFKEKIAAIKESGYFAKAMKDSIYGTKQRVEAKVDQVGEVFDASREFQRILSEIEKRIPNRNSDKPK